MFERQGWQRTDRQFFVNYEIAQDLAEMWRHGQPEICDEKRKHMRGQGGSKATMPTSVSTPTWLETRIEVNRRPSDKCEVKRNKRK